MSRQICVYCGSSSGNDPVYVEGAKALGKAMATRGHGLVYGGGNVGLMGAIADSVLEHGGEAIGVIPNFLEAKELAHPGLTELHVVETMHARKELMVKLAEGFIAMPGGFGTFEEFFEVLTWAQLGIHTHPIGLLNIAGYYDAFLTMFVRAATSGFIRPQHVELVKVSDSADELLDAFTAD